MHVGHLVLLCFIVFHIQGGPGLEPPFRPRTPMNKMPARPNYIQAASMGNMMGMDKPYQMNYKPPPSMPQGQILRHQLQVRLVSLVLLIKTPDQKHMVSLNCFIYFSFYNRCPVIVKCALQRPHTYLGVKIS